MKKYIGTIVTVVVMILYMMVSYYLLIPPINLTSGEFWIYIIQLLTIFCIITLFSLIVDKFKNASYKKSKFNKSKFNKKINIKYADMGLVSKVIFIADVCVILLFVFLSIFSSEIFNSKKYSQILQVKEGSIDDIPSVTNASAIALMDTQSAIKLGDREIGSLNTVVSQYDIEDYSYTQLNFNNTPVKVAPLAYASFFKWVNNKDKGIVGYVVVNPVSMDASYQELSKGMKYVPSAFLGQDLQRHIRNKYKTTIFEEPHFEIDEDGNPWYVAPVIKKTIGVVGGKKVTGAILIDPVTGDMKKYKLDEVPTWVDIVCPGNLICKQYNDYAQLQNGFLNSIIGQNGCRKVTENSEESTSDYGYIAKNDDIYIYTGITSVNGDSSNIGFIIANERTGETSYIEAAGADEFSAMNAAEGEVQEKGYEASFPSLITIDNVPTYIMVLKDKSGLVKLYACVNVNQYNIVATASTQEKCIDNYNRLLKGEDINPNTDENTAQKEEIDYTQYEEKDITIAKMQTIDEDGNTYLYIVDTEGKIYHAKYKDVINMLLVNVGDTVKLRVFNDNFLTIE